MLVDLVPLHDQNDVTLVRYTGICWYMGVPFVKFLLIDCVCVAVTVHLDRGAFAVLLEGEEPWGGWGGGFCRFTGRGGGPG